MSEQQREPWFAAYEACSALGMVQTTRGCSGAARVACEPLTAPLHCPHATPQRRRAALRARLASRVHHRRTL